MMIDTISEKGKGLIGKIEINTERGKIIYRYSYSISITPNVGGKNIYHKHKEGIRFPRYIEPQDTAPYIHKYHLKW